MGKLDDLWFDVLFKDKTDAGIKALRQKFDTLGADIGKKVSNDISQKIGKITAKANVVVDTQALRQSIDAVLSNYKGTIKANISNSATTSLVQDEKLRQAILKTELAQQRLRTEIERTNAAHSRAQAAAARTAAAQKRQAQAAQRAAQANKALGTSLSANNNNVNILQRMTSAAQSFGLVFTGGALLQSLIRIRGEFDMQLISLEAILQSSEQASRIYSRLQSLSVISPFQFGDLVSFAKQLSAYQIPTDELYDTTKRLADLSAGLGVDMKRIILAYGQVRAAAVLRGTELRQFTEAGIPMVDLLSKKFTELSGTVVTTSEVFDKISGREVPFAIVKEVIEDLTDKSGRFYMMQEKQAESLKGKVSNLADAYAIMMNNIGKSTDSLLKGGVNALTALMTNYDEFIGALVAITAIYGGYRAAMLLVNQAAGKNFASTVKAIQIENQKQIALLKTEHRYRSLTLAEQRLIAHNGQLNHNQIRQLATEGKLNASQLRTLYLMRQINTQTLRMSARFVGMNASTVKSLASLSKFGRACHLAAAGITNLSGKMVAFGKSNLWIIAIGAVIDGIYELTTYGNEFEEATNNAVESAKNASEELSRLKLPAVTSALKFEAKDTAQTQKAIEEVVTTIRNIIPEQGFILQMQLNGVEDIQQKGQIALSAIKTLETAIDGLKLAGDIQELEYTKDVWHGVFGEGLESDAKDAQEALRLLRQELKIAKISVDDFFSLINERNLLGSGVQTNAAVFRIAFDLDYDASTNLAEALRAYQADLKEFESEVTKSVDSIKKRITGFPLDVQKAMASIDINTILSQLKLNEEQKLMIRVQMETSLFGESDSAIEGIFSKLNKEARDYIKETGNIIDDSNVEMIRKFIRETARAYPYLKNEAEKLCADINAMKAAIQISFKTDLGNFNTIQSALRDKLGANLFNKEDAKAFNSFLLNFADTKNYSDLFETAQKGLKDTKEKIIRLQKSKNDVKVAAELAQAQSDKEWFESILKAYNQPFEKIKETTSSTDTFTEALKLRYEAIKNAIAQYEDLLKTLTPKKAKDIVLELPGIKDVLTEDELTKYLTPKGKGALIEDYLEKAKQRDTKAARTYVNSLQKELMTFNAKTVSDNITKEIARINKSLDISLRRFERYEKIYEKTGRKDFASLAAFGTSNQNNITKAEAHKAAVSQIASTVGETRPIDELLGLDAESLDGLPAKLKDAIIKAKESITEEKDDMMDKFVNVLADNMSVEEQIELVAKKYSDLSEALTKALNSGDISKEFYEGTNNSIIEQRDKEIQALRAELLKTLPVWNEIFGDTAKKSYGDLMRGRDYAQQLVANAEIKKNKEGKPTSAISSYIDADGTQKEVQLSISELDKLRKAIEELFDAASKKNPFAALVKAIEDLTTGGATVTELAALADVVGNLGNIVANCANSFADMFNAMGKGDLADTTSTIGEVASGISNIAQGFSQGGIVGGAVATITTVTSFVGNIFSKHDKKLDEIIAESKRRVKLLQKARDEIIRGIERTLGGAYNFDISSYVEADRLLLQAYEKRHSLSTLLAHAASDPNDSGAQEYARALARVQNYDRATSSGQPNGAAYLYQRDLYEEEIAELKKQRAAEADKKNADQSVIDDYTAQISILNDAVAHFAEDTLADLLGIDLKDWASQLGESLVDAFLSGEDAAAAFENSIAGLMKSVVSDMASLYILEPMMENLRKYLFGEDGKGGAFGSDFYLNEKELAGMKTYIDEIKNEGLPAIANLTETIDEALGGMLSKSEEAEGFSASIKGATEETESLLASYVNATRGDVSIIRALHQEYLPEVKTIVSAQLTQLRAISNNTYATSMASSQIVNALLSVITTTSTGKAIRIQ